MKQQFILNDGTTPELIVVGQVSDKFEAITIQISKVINLEDEVECTPNIVTYGLKYIYEEIDADDMVIYAHYVGAMNVYKNYPKMWVRLNGGG